MKLKWLEWIVDNGLVTVCGSVLLIVVTLNKFAWIVSGGTP